ncbi:MAG TPA: hypothetical protein VFN73_06955 [Propionibacteriaceae bacterium]|nr:hypothetical protein [Propionibacteriaceae bacterium]
MTASALERLRRWVDAGGTWRPVTVGDAAASVSLCRCDDPGEMERVSSADPDFVAAVRRPDAGLLASLRDD